MAEKSAGNGALTTVLAAISVGLTVVVLALAIGVVTIGGGSADNKEHVVTTNTVTTTKEYHDADVAYELQKLKEDIESVHSEQSAASGTLGNILASVGALDPVTTEVFSSRKGFSGDNVCAGQKVVLDNIPCATAAEDFALGTKEQSGVNVTKGYQGDLNVDSVPITNPYYMEGLCPVNVHWHLGTEHYSKGEYDEHGSGPSASTTETHRLLAGDSTRAGYQCHYYNENNPIFTTEYNWQHCVDTHVGETYEVHWPHSNHGDCGTVTQYQAPFYDGVFCHTERDLSNLGSLKVGVQGQIFTIVNDEQYYYPDLIRGMIVDGEMGSDIAKYTGSTTGTSRDNEMCSQYAGITWQVDRQCHLISASSFDKMCADMKAQRDDMSGDLYPHGSRELVDDAYAADNHQRRLRFVE